MAAARCDGVIVTDVNGVPSCEDLAGAPLGWVAVEPFSLDDIDSVVAGEMFAIGFVLYGMTWLMGRAVGMILQSIKRG